VSDPTTTDLTRADVCAVAIAEAFRGDGERLCNPIGNLPLIGGRLALATFEPELALTDGFYTLVDPQSPDDVPPIGVSEAERLAGRTVAHWNPYREMFGLLWQGKRHVMMGATQIDQYGNQNIAMLGALAAFFALVARLETPVSRAGRLARRAGAAAAVLGCAVPLAPSDRFRDAHVAAVMAHSRAEHDRTHVEEASVYEDRGILTL
jgi:acyl CoA:acetate/3-ketoacid CoA transferase beta subunit